MNVSSRFTMADVPKKHSQKQMAQLAEEGFFYWEFTVKGNPHKIKVTQEEMDEFIKMDVSFLHRIPFSIPVLTCHGTEDEVINFADAAKLSNVVPNHTLIYIPGATHFFRGKCEVPNHCSDSETASDSISPFPSLLLL